MPNKPKPLNTSLLSLFQFLGAVLVIALHCRRLFEADQLHFIQKSIFSRMVVPYFMVTASFFLRRNGLFYAPIFVLTGFYLADKLNQPIFQHRQKTKLLVCIALLTFEATIIYLNQGYDKNFLFSLIPFTAYLVAWTLTIDLFRQKKFQFLKEYASYHYFIHVIPVEVSFFFLENYSLTIIQQGWLVFFITIITCQLLSWLIINTQ
ncbi:hypothetical protein RMQ61_07445 [Streptococcus suis]|uniref:hypothetical protein n=1 Tax=Streptococcus suis TaxID=1307 RepID=UPI0028C4F4C5|nr:hypothetical protein [Streptococcus suis]WNO77726.1 hypothetical protein RMP67_07725 [Streptococcus suis]WNO81894.1 hypothetical protein RMQ61_07445 [Streptococcus suis]